MDSNFDDINEKALKSLRYMTNSLNHDFEFYECRFEYEYKPFEESIKQYYDLE